VFISCEKNVFAFCELQHRPRWTISCSADIKRVERGITDFAAEFLRKMWVRCKNAETVKKLNDGRYEAIRQDSERFVSKFCVSVVVRVLKPYSKS